MPRLSSTDRRLKELAWVFFKLGATAFGGPAAHIALMNDEIVQRRRWLDQQRFLDLIGATNLIPGPNSTEMAIHIGYERAGWRGLLVAGAAFILPAMAIVWVLAAVYARYNTLPQLAWLMYGIKPVIIAVVAQALWALGKVALKGRPATVAAAVTAGLALLGYHEILLLALAGTAVMLTANWRSLSGRALAVPAPALFLSFLKIGSVLYGSGYVLLAFLQREFVLRYGWISQEALLDAVTVGQFTPGPLFTTATFIGYLLGGGAGAVAATVGIFLPAFLFVAISRPWIERLRRSPWTGGCLDGVNAASLALMAVVTWQLGRAALVDWLTIAAALVALGALVRYRVNSAWLVLGGGVLGYLAHLGGLA